MLKTKYYLFILMTAIACLLFSGVSAAEKQSLPIDLLKQHGISFNTDDLLLFLQKGFPYSTDYSKLPADPPQKTQLLIYAIQEMGKRKKKEAVPVLINYASLEIPKDAKTILMRDIEKIPINNREVEQKRINDFLKYNAIIALGWIQEGEAKDIIRKNYDEEQDPLIKLSYAISLGMLGDDSVMDYVVSLISSKEKEESVKAAQNYYYMTGVNPDISINTSAAKRAEQAKVVSEYWAKEKANFKVDKSAVYRRRLAPVDDMPKVQEGSLRDLLLRASFVLDFTNKMGSADARETLNKKGSAINDDLEKISFDLMEDLRIRSEAIRRYAYINGKEAKSFLKKLRKDKDAEIAELASGLLDKIK